jgi:hypothetical protein
MTNQSTIDKLIEMRLTAMADAFRNQLDNPKSKELPFDDQFGMLVDIEYSSRKNNRLKRLIMNAGFDQPEANIMDINYTSGRKYCSTGNAGNLQRFSAPSINLRSGMTNWVVMTAHWQMQSLIALPMTVIVSTSQA